MSLLFLMIKQAQYDRFISFSFSLFLFFSLELLFLVDDDVVFIINDVDGKN